MLSVHQQLVLHISVDEEVLNICLSVLYSSKEITEENTDSDESELIKKNKKTC